MASNLQLHSGSPLIGSPIVYKVTAGSPVGEVTFQRVKLRVKAGLSSEGQYYNFEFSQPVTKGETVYIDISSALRSVADKYEFSFNAPDRYPYIAFSLEACDEYMQNGQNSGDVGIVTNSGGRALMGRFSDLERLKTSRAGRNPTKFTRKPGTSMEVVFTGSTFLRPVPMVASLGNITNGPRVTKTKIEEEGVQTIWDDDGHTSGTTVYAVPFPYDGYELRFVNGLGCVESVCVHTLAQEEVKVTTDELVIARQQLFNEVSHGLTLKQNDQERWKCSSGPLDRAWQQWFLHEFVMTPAAWVCIDHIWVPCHIIPEESVRGFDRTKGGLLEVQFTIALDIAGSPFADLAI